MQLVELRNRTPAGIAPRGPEIDQDESVGQNGGSVSEPFFDLDSRRRFADERQVRNGVVDREFGRRGALGSRGGGLSSGGGLRRNHRSELALIFSVILNLLLFGFRRRSGVVVEFLLQFGVEVS